MGSSIHLKRFLYFLTHDVGLGSSIFLLDVMWMLAGIVWLIVDVS
jgi:hypothetical protein